MNVSRGEVRAVGAARRRFHVVCGGLLLAATIAGGGPLLAQAGSGLADTQQVRLAIPGRVNVEPSIAVRAALVAVGWVAYVGDAADLYVAVSRDGGVSFAPPVRVNDRPGTIKVGGELAPRVAFGAPRGRGAGPNGEPAVVALWTGREPTATIRLAESVDGGRTFGPSRAVQGAGAAGNRGWASLAVDERGGAHVLWLDHRALAGAAGEMSQHQHGAQADGVAKAQQSGLYYAGSGVPRELVTGVCYCCKTAFIAGPRGTLFGAWRHVYQGNIRDIAFIASRDGGRTFGATVRVSRDDWQIDGCPEDGPALAADVRGALHLAWPTVVPAVLPAAEPYKAVFYAASADAASAVVATFSPRVQVSAPGRHAGHPQIVVNAGSIPTIVWDETIAGRSSVMASSRRSNGTFGEAVRLSGPAAAVYPVAAADGRTLIAAWRDGEAATSTIAVRRIPPP